MSAHEALDAVDCPQTLAELVDECRSLCAGAELAISTRGGERQDFLAQSLGDALEQVGLILRVAGDEGRLADEPEDGILSRLKRNRSRKSLPDDELGGAQIPEDGFAPQGLQGNSWTISLPELLGFLSSAGKTGMMWIDTPSENFLIGLENGDLVHATSSCTPEGLRPGEVLVGLGFLTRRQLERFLERQVDDSWLSGSSLLETGMISEEELHAALVYQVQQLFHRIIDNRRALFRFRDGLEVQQSNQVRLNVTKLLLESARVQDELQHSGLLNALVGNSTPVRAAAPFHDWNAWQQQLASIEVRESPAPAAELPPSVEVEVDDELEQEELFEDEQQGELSGELDEDASPDESDKSAESDGERDGTRDADERAHRPRDPQASADSASGSSDSDEQDPADDEDED